MVARNWPALTAVVKYPGAHGRSKLPATRSLTHAKARLGRRRLADICSCTDPAGSALRIRRAATCSCSTTTCRVYRGCSSAQNKHTYVHSRRPQHHVHESAGWRSSQNSTWIYRARRKGLSFAAAGWCLRMGDRRIKRPAVCSHRVSERNIYENPNSAAVRPEYAANLDPSRG